MEEKKKKAKAPQGRNGQGEATKHPYLVRWQCPVYAESPGDAAKKAAQSLGTEVCWNWSVIDEKTHQGWNVDTGSNTDSPDVYPTHYEYNAYKMGCTKKLVFKGIKTSSTTAGKKGTGDVWVNIDLTQHGKEIRFEGPGVSAMLFMLMKHAVGKNLVDLTVLGLTKDPGFYPPPWLKEEEAGE